MMEHFYISALDPDDEDEDTLWDDIDDALESQ